MKKVKPWTMECVDVINRETGKAIAELRFCNDKTVVAINPLIRVVTRNERGQRVTYFLARPNRYGHTEDTPATDVSTINSNDLDKLFDEIYHGNDKTALKLLNRVGMPLWLSKNVKRISDALRKQDNSHALDLLAQLKEKLETEWTFPKAQ